MRRSALASVTLALFFASASARADAGDKTFSVPYIKVPVEESTRLRPDRATIRLSVALERPTMAEAAAETGKKTQALLDALRGLSIQREAISTDGLNLAPVWVEQVDPATRRLTRRDFKGYRATTRIKATLQDVERAGEVASRLIASGADAIDSVDFAISDAEKYLDALRPRAVANARKRANLYASGGGLKLGRVLLIDIEPKEYADAQANLPLRRETGLPHPVVIPTEPGEITISTKVEVTWELLQDAAPSTP